MSILTLYVTLHSIGFTVWVGMALLLPVVILPVIRSLDEPGRTRIMAAISRRFLVPFIVSGLVVGATGWAQTILIPAFADHPIIYIKHVVVVLLVLVSAYIWFLLGPKFGKAGSDSSGLWKQLEILSWIQLVLGAATLFLCAWMIT
jgi:uncharacterized membrane protein